MPPPITAILIPVDGPARPVPIEAVTYHSQLKDLLGGWPEHTRYDLDSTLMVHDEGRIIGLPINQLVTDYVLRDSLAARQTTANGRHFPAGYGLYGPVVVVGNDQSGEPIKDAPKRWQVIAGLDPGPDRHPYVEDDGDSLAGRCRRSAEIDREEADTLDMLDPRREALVVSAWRWLHQAARLEAKEAADGNR